MKFQGLKFQAPGSYLMSDSHFLIFSLSPCSLPPAPSPLLLLSKGYAHHPAFQYQRIIRGYQSHFTSYFFKGNSS